MNNEPKAGMSIDPEMLAAYIDKRLSPEQRAKVEAQLAGDPDSYALLVETLKTQDALGPARKESRPSRSRHWLIAGGLLAAAASLILLVRTGGSGGDSLAKLAAAVGSERPTEARVTGGFGYAPLRRVTRGDDSSPNLALLAAAGELQKGAASQPTAANRHAWAVAQLLTGQAAAASEALASLVSEDATNAEWHSDLAAALLVRVAAGDNAQLVPAIEHASTAARLNPRLPEASYNRALALEKSSLFDEAIQEWRRFISIEADPAWRADAESHIQEIERRAPAKPSARIPTTVDELLAASPSGMQSDPARWREVIEGPLLIAAINAKSAAAIDAGVRVARSLESITGDALPRMTWEDVARRAGAQELAPGFASLQSGTDLLKANNATQARIAFQQAERTLASARSPASRWAEFYVSYCTFYLGETRPALERFEQLARRAEADGQLTIAMKSYYMAGLGRLRMGQHAAVVEVQRRTADLARRLGDREVDALARAEIADAMWRLSLTEAGWRERNEVLRLASDADLPNVRHVAFTSAARQAAAENHLAAADSFARAALDNAVRWGNPAALAESRIRLADIADRRHDADAALALLADAERNLDSLPDGTFTESWRADLEIARGAALLGRSDRDASAASERAFEILTRRQSPFRLARAHWVRGKALAGSDVAKARAEFRQGLQASEVTAGSVDPFGRSLAEQRWMLLRELAALPLEDSSNHGLTPILSVLLGANAGRVVDVVQRHLDDGDLILVFLALDQQLLRWQLSKTRVDRISIPIALADLTTLVAAHSGVMATPASADWPQVNQRLASKLFQGVDAAVPRRLMLVTDATTSPIAFATLQWPGSTAFLADETELLTVGSSGGSRFAEASSAPRALIVGAPSSAGKLWPALQGAREEAVAVAALYDHATLLLGADATRTRFMAELPKADIIHFAGHAVGDAADPSASRLLLAADDNGIDITAADIVAQHVRARVVVLGSCQGAAGAAAGNVSIQGLARAFLQGGAQTVIAAQWNVDDQFSNAFLTTLHTRLVAGAAPTRALRDAQTLLRHDRRFQHPYYWAGFSIYSRLSPQMETKNEA